MTFNFSVISVAERTDMEEREYGHGDYLYAEFTSERIPFKNRTLGYSYHLYFFTVDWILSFPSLLHKISGYHTCMHILPYSQIR